MTEQSRRTLSETIKTAVTQSRLSVNGLAKRAGVPQPVLHRFVTGETSVTLATADRLCAYLGLELRPPKAEPSSQAAGGTLGRSSILESHGEAV